MIPTLGGCAQTGGLDGWAPIVTGLLRQQRLFWSAATTRAEALQRGTREWELPAVWPAAKPLHTVASDAVDYGVDAVQRQALFWDAMR